jgi:alpha-mannosidase
MLKYELQYPALGAHLNSIRRRVYRVVCRLNAEILPSAEPIPFSELGQHSFTEASRGASWGRKLSCAWLRISGSVPEGLNNPVLLVHNTGEGLLYTPEGEILDGLSDIWAPNDIPRASGKCVSLRLPGMTAGKAFTYYMDYGYNGIVLNDIGRARFFGAFLAETDESVYAYYYDYITLFVLLAETEDTEKKRELSRALERSYRVFIKDGADAAREVLAVPLSKRSREEMTFQAVGHGHLDLAWMWPIRETVRKSARTYAMALSNIARYPDYIYGTSQPQQLQWMKERNPLLYARIRRRSSTAESSCRAVSGRSATAIYPAGNRSFGRLSTARALPKRSSANRCAYAGCRTRSALTATCRRFCAAAAWSIFPPSSSPGTR